MYAVGKARRLARMVDSASGRMLCMPLDHGMQVGSIDGLRDPGPLLDIVVDAGVNAVIVNPGMLARFSHRFDGGPAVILRLDQTTMWRTGSPTGYADTHTRLVATVEEAVQMGAEAVITYLFTCNNDPAQETRCVEICGSVASACRSWGMVHVIEAMAARGGFASADDPAVVAMNCRIAGEMGADFIKTDWCGAEGFAAVARESLAPVAVAGGMASGSNTEILRLVECAFASGAKGIIFGRNVFQREDPGSLLRKIKSCMTA